MNRFAEFLKKSGVPVDVSATTDVSTERLAESVKLKATLAMASRIGQNLRDAVPRAMGGRFGRQVHSSDKSDAASASE